MEKRKRDERMIQKMIFKYFLFKEWLRTVVFLMIVSIMKIENKLDEVKRKCENITKVKFL